jgi:hypothetical protein
VDDISTPDGRFVAQRSLLEPDLDEEWVRIGLIRLKLVVGG